MQTTTAMKPPAYKPKTHYWTRHSSREYPIIDAACDFGPTCLDDSRREPPTVPRVAAARVVRRPSGGARLAAAVLVVCGVGGALLGALLALS